MKVLVVHNFYLNPGGEDEVFRAETESLQEHGHDVRVYTVHNSDIASINKVALAASTIWNRRVARKLLALLNDFTPDLVHFHNTFPLVSPAAYVAVATRGIPVVQTLHNFRLLCLNASFLRNGTQCEACLGKALAWPGVQHGCYRESRPASAVVAAMLAIHRWRGTWNTAINTYIALSEFARDKFVTGGLPADRIVVKPNFLRQDPGRGAHQGRFALFVGRLSPEKGISGLVRLWHELGPDFPLQVIGDGPLQSLAAKAPAGIEWLGWQPRERVLAAMKDASFLVFPTQWYEGFPMVLLEAMATGLPIIGSDLGSLSEIIGPPRAGVLVRSRESEQWIRTLKWAMSNPEDLAAMGQRGRNAYESQYSPEIGYRRLLEVYRETIDRTKPGVGAKPTS